MADSKERLTAAVSGISKQDHLQPRITHLLENRLWCASENRAPDHKTLSNPVTGTARHGPGLSDPPPQKVGAS